MDNFSRKAVLILITGVILSCLFIFGQADAAVNGVLRVLPENPRYFTDDTGKAIYLTGSHTWSNLQDYVKVGSGNSFNFEEYLNFLEGKNHNFFRLWITTESDLDRDNQISAEPSMYLRTTDPSKGLSYDGKPKYDLGKINPEFLNRIYDRVAMAQAKGIYVSIMFFDSLGAGYGFFPNEAVRNINNSNPFRAGNNINGIDGDTNHDGVVAELHTNLNPGEMRNRIKAIQKNYVRQVVEKVNNFDNVLFEVGNELPYESIDFQHEMINYIRQVETDMNGKRHPIGMTGGNPLLYPHSWRNFTYDEMIISPADWISPAIPRAGNYMPDPPMANGDKIIILDTDHIDPWRDTYHWDDAWIWKSFLRGHNPIYMDVIQFPFALYPTTYSWNNPNQPPQGGVLSVQARVRLAMGHTKTYADKMDLVHMTPIDDNSCSSTNYCLANPGSEYLVYQPNSGSFNVNLTQGSYGYEWFDPISGNLGVTGSVNVLLAGNIAFTPATAESVLHLKKINPVECTTDNDNDGFYLDGGNCGALDCNDNSSTVYPGAPEVCGDGIDQDCDGVDRFCQLAGHWNFNETSGTAFMDSSGNGNHGTCVTGKCPFSVPGVKDTALYFNGEGDYVNLGNDQSLRVFTDGVWSWASWIKPTGAVGSDSEQILFDSMWLTPTVNYWKGENGIILGIFDTYRVPTEAILVKNVINPNVWSHIAFTSDLVNFKLYINGELIKTEPYQQMSSVSGQAYRVGSNDTPNQHYQGAVDDLRIFDKALSREEIVRVMSEGNMPDPADVNGDTHVNIKDIQVVIQVIIGAETNPDVVGRANVNGDGRVNIKDIQEVIRKIINPSY